MTTSDHPAGLQSAQLGAGLKPNLEPQLELQLDPPGESEAVWPVVVVGAGPTGLLLTHLLAKRGVKVCLIDQLESVVQEPRAVSIDDESLRSLADAQVLEGFLPQITLSYGVHYYSWRQRLFAKVEPRNEEYGHPKRNAFRQQQLVAHLFETLKHYPQVTVRMGTRLEALEQEQAEDSPHRLGSQDPGAVLHCLHQGAPLTLRCRYVVACDGARSSVREKLGLAFDGSTYSQRWLITDMIGREDTFRHTRTYCDPKRPAIRLPGPQGTLRYEFMLHHHETSEEVLDEKVYGQWIRDRHAPDAQLTLLRKVVYTFHARVASQWKKGSVLLAGDAAHLTPPFAGQGMNSGIRDATNLAWKLAQVVQGQASARLLETYECERKPHAWSLIQMALRIGVVMQPMTLWGAVWVQSLLKVACWVPAARDYILHLKFKPKPRFKAGFFDAQTPKGAKVACGQLMPQPRMQRFDSSMGLLDEFCADGFVLLQWAHEAPAVPTSPMDWRHAPALKVIHVLRASEDFLPSSTAGSAGEQSGDCPCIRDVDGQLEGILSSAHARGVLLRPDHYVLTYIGQDEAWPQARIDALFFGLDAQPSPDAPKTTALS